MIALSRWIICDDPVEAMLALVAMGDLRLDWIVLSSFLAPAVFVLLLVAHFRFWPMPQ